MEATKELIYRCTVCHAVYSAGERFCPLDAGPIAPDGDTDPRIGRTIDGRYFVRRLIGRGGMGAVYEADHVGLDKRVAIKFLAINKTDRDALARFRREAKIASKIVHEHVVQIFDVGTADADTDFIVMELIEGKDLAAVLQDDGPIDPERTVSIARKVLRGLRAIHQAGIVHRDIKPANILLSPREDDRDFVKIMDFGISRPLSGDTITNTGAIIGTPEYMSPEQLLADDIDQRADLYAVGIMMFRMVTGKLPFTSDTFDRSAAANPYVDVPALDAVKPHVPRAIAAAVSKAVAKDRDDRYADAQAFLTALESLGATSQHSRSSKPSVAPRPSVTGTEQTEVPLASADTAIAPASGITTPAKRTDPRLPVQHAAATVSPAPTEVTRSRSGLWVALGLLIVGAAVTAIVVASSSGSAPDPVAATPPLVTPPSRPAGGPPTASPSSENKAAALLVKGRAAENAGKLDEAIDAYSAAYAIEPTADIIFQIAELHERLGHNALASVAFQRYLHLNMHATDRDLVLARIAKLEKAAAAPATKPPAGTAAPGSAAPKDDLLDCHCIAKNGIPDTQSLCDIKGPSLCECRSDGNVPLCPVQVTQGSSPDTFECPDKKYDTFRIAGTHDTPCRGFGTWSIEPEIDGKLSCSICTHQVKPRLFRGHEREACAGYQRETGQRIDGLLSCD